MLNIDFGRSWRKQGLGECEREEIILAGPVHASGF